MHSTRVAPKKQALKHCLHHLESIAYRTGSPKCAEALEVMKASGFLYRLYATLGRSRPSSMPYIGPTWALGLSPAHGVMACPFVFAAWLRFCSNRAVADCGRRLLGAAASAEPKNAKRSTDFFRDVQYCSVYVQGVRGSLIWGSL